MAARRRISLTFVAIHFPIAPSNPNNVGTPSEGQSLGNTNSNKANNWYPVNLSYLFFSPMYRSIPFSSIVLSTLATYESIAAISLYASHRSIHCANISAVAVTDCSRPLVWQGLIFDSLITSDGVSYEGGGRSDGGGTLSRGSSLSSSPMRMQIMVQPRPHYWTARGGNTRDSSSEF